MQPRTSRRGSRRLPATLGFLLSSRSALTVRRSAQGLKRCYCGSDVRFERDKLLQEASESGQQLRHGLRFVLPDGKAAPMTQGCGELVQRETKLAGDERDGRKPRINVVVLVFGGFQSQDVIWSKACPFGQLPARQLRALTRGSEERSQRLCHLRSFFIWVSDLRWRLA